MNENINAANNVNTANNFYQRDFGFEREMRNAGMEEFKSAFGLLFASAVTIGFIFNYAGFIHEFHSAELGAVIPFFIFFVIEVLIIGAINHKATEMLLAGKQGRKKTVLLVISIMFPAIPSFNRFKAASERKKIMMKSYYGRA